MKDFFGHQERAQYLSRKLAFLFLLAVVATVFFILLACAGFFYVGLQIDPFDFSKLGKAYSLIAIANTALIGFASLLKVSDLKQHGGISIALELGAKNVSPSTPDSSERQLLNVVEEMAIASGVPMPEVFVLPDKSINAFAAGNTYADSVVCVTRGCLDSLSRDELQGVVAHEFSHIFHGDAKLNMKISGMIFGILALSLLGKWMLSGTRRRTPPAVIFLGFSFVAIGSLGALFGRIIQASLSRQREFLADASAVQYTRNPSGIGGALRKIGDGFENSVIENFHAESYSHFFIAPPAMNRKSFSWFSTHPPIERRLRALNQTPRPAEGPKKSRQTEEIAPTPGHQRKIPSAQSVALGIGSLNPLAIASAHFMLSNLSRFLEHKAGDPYFCRAIVYSVFFSPDEVIQSRQRQVLRENRQDDLEVTVLKSFEELQKIGKSGRLVFIDHCLQALRILSNDQRRDFLKTIRGLIKADQKVELHEYALYSLLSFHLLPPKELLTEAAMTSDLDAKSILVSSLIHISGLEKSEAEEKYRKIIEKNYLKLGDFKAYEAFDYKEITQSLLRLRKLRPTKKQALLFACLDAASTDDHLNPEALELLRAFGECLEVPIAAVG